MSAPASVGDPNEPDLSFASAVHKVRWAEHHIDEMNRILSVLIENCRQTTGLGGETDRQYIGIRNFAIPPEILCAIGDTCHNLRSALDCCWMGLKRAQGVVKDGKNTLPRDNGRKGVETTIDQTTVESSFPGAKRFILEDLQAFEGGNEILWLVGKIDNWDKHNMLVASIQSTTFHRVTGKNRFGASFDLSGLRVEGISTVEAIKLPIGAKLDQQANITFDVILQSRVPPDERHLMPFLRAALEDTRKGVDGFISRFGKKATNG